MHTKRYPFSETGLKAFDIVVKTGTGELRPSVPADCPPDLAELILKCTEFDPAGRPSFVELLSTFEQTDGLLLSRR